MLRLGSLALIIVASSGCGSQGNDAGPMVDGTALGVAGAHEHGILRMGVALDGPQVTVDLQIPGETIFGFEHAPSSDEERSAVAQALAKFRNDAGSMISFAAEAACAVNDVEFLEHPAYEMADAMGSHEGDHDPSEHHPDGDYQGHEAEHAHDQEHDGEHGHDADEAHDADDDEGHDPEHEHAEDQDHADHADEHTEVRIAVRWTCEQPADGSEASLGLAGLFPNAEAVDLTVVTAGGQAAGRVAPDAAFRF